MRGAYNMNNIVKVDKNGELGLDVILKGTNVKAEDVFYYTMENGGNGVTFTFFDKNKNTIKVKPRTTVDLAKDIKKIMKKHKKSLFPDDLIELIDREIKEK